MLDLIASRFIDQGRELLELYCVRRHDGAADRYRLVWADAFPVGGRSKCRILDIRDYTAANHGERAKAEFRRITEGKGAALPIDVDRLAEADKAEAKAVKVEASRALVEGKGKAVWHREGGEVHAAPTWGPLPKAEAVKASREAKAAAKGRAVPYANGWAVAEREALAAVMAAEAERDREAAKAKARVLAAVAEGKAEAIRREAEARAEARAVAVAYSPASPAALAKAGRALAEAMPTRAEAEADPHKAAVAVAVARALLAVALKAEAAALVEAKARTASARLALIKAEARAVTGRA